MFLIITPENDIPNELALINSLFQLGLEVLHVRKPHKNYAQHMAYLSGIEEQYHGRIMLHYEHDLAEDFMLKGVHIQEQPRLELGEDFGLYVARFTSQGYDVSSSFHDPADIEFYKTVPLLYSLLSPVFAAISNKNMKGKGFDVSHLKPPVIGMGGINAQSIPKTKKLGYTGIGVLGGVWNADDPIAAFQDVLKIYRDCFKSI